MTASLEKLIRVSEMFDGGWQSTYGIINLISIISGLLAEAHLYS